VSWSVVLVFAVFAAYFAYRTLALERGVDSDLKEYEKLLHPPPEARKDVGHRSGEGGLCVQGDAGLSPQLPNNGCNVAIKEPELARWIQDCRKHPSLQSLSSYADAAAPRLRLPLSSPYC
jgi:hypothetical protein